MELIDHTPGNYRFLKGLAPYSSGVVAMMGFEIIRVRLRHPIPLNASAVDRIDRYLGELGQPIQALCAMELRIPEPLSFEGFTAFNMAYLEMLMKHSLLPGGINPIARTNIVPVHSKLDQACISAFSHTMRQNHKNKCRSFIIAGAGDLSDQSNLTPDAIIRPHESSVDALKEKATTVMQVMQARLSGLQVSWEDVTSVSIYTSTPLHSYLVDTILKRMEGATLGGVNWHYSNPPIAGLAFEMDMRGIWNEFFRDLG